MPIAPDARRGASVVEACLATLPTAPGVYRMIAAGGEVLYVGKARNLKKRVAAYASPGRLGPRLHRMVADTAAMEFVTTHTEAEALLLEVQPDQAPAAALQHPAARRQVVRLHPGDRRSSVSRACSSTVARSRERATTSGRSPRRGRSTARLTALQRAFLLRSCSDTVFAARTRPCLLYQIKRCSAPCVGRIGEDDYAALVAQARDFLKGDTQRIQRDLARRMEAASEALDFEEAAATATASGR